MLCKKVVRGRYGVIKRPALYWGTVDLQVVLLVNLRL